MKRVLIANIFGIGDVLFTTPIIANLKQVYPDIEISYLCNGRVKDIISNDPGIDEVFVYEKDDIICCNIRNFCIFRCICGTIFLISAKQKQLR
jgi:ADP-heptose:LPS heptosyltransferase